MFASALLGTKQRGVRCYGRVGDENDMSRRTRGGNSGDECSQVRKRGVAERW